MRTITAILEPDEDGNLHLPVPEELQFGSRIRVVATLVVEDSMDEEGSLYRREQHGRQRKSLLDSDLVAMVREIFSAGKQPRHESLTEKEKSEQRSDPLISILRNAKVL
jgi:hypothetical protein